MRVSPSVQLAFLSRAAAWMPPRLAPQLRSFGSETRLSSLPSDEQGSVLRTTRNIEANISCLAWLADYFSFDTME